MTQSWIRGLTLLAFVFLAGCVSPPSSGGPTKRDGGTSKPDFAMTAGGDCGSNGEACCPGDVCDTGLQCNPKSGGCCTAGSNACTTTGQCCSGLTCTSGKCCSAISVACTSSKDCCAGLTCTAGVCDKTAGTCGDANKPCCMPGSTCSSGNACVSGMCTPCGATGKACCAGMGCDAGLTCTNNKCEGPCGNSGQECCKGATPCKSSSLMCNTSTNKCVPTSGSPTMGGLNQPCKTGRLCDGGLSCIGTPGTCQNPPTCNTAGATCCSGNTCTGGLVCNSSTNKCGMPAATCTAVQAQCSQTSQCCPSLSCTPSIIPSGDTANTCCVGVGKSCFGGSYDCCGWLICVDGKCTAGPDGDPCLSHDDCLSKQCKDGYCASNATMCGGLKPLLYSCNSASECCDGASCLNTGGQPEPQSCCREAGAVCAGDSSICCGRMQCGTTGTCDCRKQTETCLVDEECCEGTCMNFVCANAGASSPGPGEVCVSGETDCMDLTNASFYCGRDTGAGTTTCCTFVTGSSYDCTSNAECCGVSVCDKTNGFGFGSKHCCSPVGEACSGGGDCCGGADCDSVSGLCVP